MEDKIFFLTVKSVSSSLPDPDCFGLVDIINSNPHINLIAYHNFDWP